MMHCTMDDLLALRAGEASTWARQHLGDCGICRGALDAVYQRVAAMKALPVLAPARDRWPVVRTALRERRRAGRAWSVVGLAAAAALAGLVVFRSGGAGPLNTDELATLKQQSAALESELGYLAPNDRVMSGREAALGGLLEDQIAVIDGELGHVGLSGGPVPVVDRVDLWRERVDLMQQLYTVRVTRASSMGL
jgi:hypothetical protein